jgi:hypothetical protein
MGDNAIYSPPAEKSDYTVKSFLEFYELSERLDSRCGLSTAPSE